MLDIMPMTPPRPQLIPTHPPAINGEVGLQCHWAETGKSSYLMDARRHMEQNGGEISPSHQNKGSITREWTPPHNGRQHIIQRKEWCPKCRSVCLPNGCPAFEFGANGLPQVGDRKNQVDVNWDSYGSNISRKTVIAPFVINRSYRQDAGSIVLSLRTTRPHERKRSGKLREIKVQC